MERNSSIEFLILVKVLFSYRILFESVCLPMYYCFLKVVYFNVHALVCACMCVCHLMGYGEPSHQVSSEILKSFAFLIVFQWLFKVLPL